MKDIFRKNNTLLIFVFGLFFIFLVIISELFYISNNDSRYLREYYLVKTKSFSEKNDVSNSLNYLFKAASLRINEQEKRYSEIFSKKNFITDKDIILNSKYDNSVYLEYLKSIDIQNIFGDKDIDFLRIFYNLALIANDNSYIDDILPFLQISMYMEPELSHIHIEIANYFLLTNRVNEARGQLKTCATLKSPAYHCLYYQEEQFNNNEIYGVGFLKNEIDEQYK